jgi:RND family efflux transporter MFP subunit
MGGSVLQQNSGFASLAAALFIYASGGTARAADPAPVEATPVQVAAVTEHSVTPRTWLPGSIVSRADARIASVVGGRVVWVADVGQRVKAGTPLARLDDSVIRLRVADLAAQVARARAQRALAASQAERYDQLAATQALSASQLEEARAQRDMSAADVARAEAQLRQAQHEIADSEIRAPFSGVVTERFIQPGEYVSVGAATVRLVNTADVEARATGALELAANVRPGETVTVRDGERELSGRVRAVVPVGDDRSRQFEVRIAVARADWLVGTPVEVSLPTAPGRKAVTVPRDALLIRQNRSYVLRVTRQGTVEELDVTPGVAVSDLVEVQGALSPGDRLVVRGGERLSAGQPVRILGELARAPKSG